MKKTRQLLALPQWPTPKDIAIKLEMARSTVCSIIDRYKKFGSLEVEKREKSEPLVL